MSVRRSAPRLVAAGTAALLLATSAVTPAFAQPASEPDVVLDIPNLEIQELILDVQKLRALISLDARLGTLLTLTAGVDAQVEQVRLELRGVKAEAHLRVRLENVVRIIDRTLTTVDKNPQILTSLLNAVSGLLSQTVNTLGQTVLRVVQSTGDIVQHTLDGRGNTLAQQVVGNVNQLPVISQTTNAVGQVVKQVRDTSGAVIEVVYNQAGEIVSTRVVSQAVGGAGR